MSTSFRLKTGYSCILARLTLDRIQIFLVLYGNIVEDIAHVRRGTDG